MFFDTLLGSLMMSGALVASYPMIPKAIKPLNVIATAGYSVAIAYHIWQMLLPVLS